MPGTPARNKCCKEFGLEPIGQVGVACRSDRGSVRYLHGKPHRYQNSGGEYWDYVFKLTSVHESDVEADILVCEGFPMVDGGPSRFFLIEKDDDQLNKKNFTIPADSRKVHDKTILEKLSKAVSESELKKRLARLRNGR